MKSLKLLFWPAVAYGVLLLVARGLVPSESLPSVSLVGIPLIVVAVVIARDLAKRSTRPTGMQTIAYPIGARESPMQFLSAQISVVASASNSYFENVVRARLKELLIKKVSVETGLESDVVRRALSDQRQGPELLRDGELYTVLYGPLPKKGQARLQMIEQTVDLIGAWKG